MTNTVKTKRSQVHLSVRDANALREFLTDYCDDQENVDKWRLFWKQPENKNLLHSAVRSGCLESVMLLLDRSVNIDETDDEGRTALIIAASEGNGEVTKLLVEFGADVNATDTEGQNCCHWAFCMEHRQLGDWLLSHSDVDKHQKDVRGRTVLSYKDESGDESESGKQPVLRSHLSEEKQNEEATAVIINGSDTNFACGSGLKVARWLNDNTENGNGVMYY